MDKEEKMTKPVSQNTSLPSISRSNGKSRYNIVGEKSGNGPISQKHTIQNRQRNKETTPVFFPNIFYISFYFSFFFFNGECQTFFVDSARYVWNL